MFSFKSVRRFSLLLLEEGEDYLHQFVVDCHWPLEVEGNWHAKPTLPGTLRLCTKSLFFEPDDIRSPVVRFPLKFVQHLEPVSERIFTLTTSSLTKMKDNNADRPYVHFKRESHWRFELLYAAFDRFLKMVTEQMALKDDEELLQRCMQKRVDDAFFDASRLVDFSETILHECPATHIEPLVQEPGKFVVTNLRVYYQPLTSVNGFQTVYTHPLESIAAVSRRRSSLKPYGLEIFFLPPDDRLVQAWDSPCALFEFRSEIERDNVLQLLLEKIKPGKIPGGVLESQGEWLGRIGIAWQFGRISNFDYLLYLNLASGRTFNDLRQWPVFPWILQDYSSPVLDLENPNVYRDLSKPIGALNPDRLATFKERFHQLPVDGFPPRFLYGTHYSTPGYVMFWLVRAAPAHILQLQSGRFDAPDRMFYGVGAAWESVLNNPADVKELIPEFFLPNSDFLINRFHLALGKRQNGKSVDDVELPPWANDPLDFLSKHRAALESPYVSEHLHRWIDLIFGCRQSGEAAVDADNVFYYLSYEGAVDLDAVDDPLERKGLEAQINEFGQTPKQLFEHPHPPRQCIPPIPDPQTIFGSYTLASHDADGTGAVESQGIDNQALSLALLSMVTSSADSEGAPTEFMSRPSRTISEPPASENPHPSPQPERSMRKNMSIYDQVKQQWGWDGTASKDVRKSVTQTVKRLETGLNRFVDHVNEKLTATPKRAWIDRSASWSGSLINGTTARHETSFLLGKVLSMTTTPSDGGTLYCAGDNATLKMFGLENGNQIRSARIERMAGRGLPLSSLDLLPHLRPEMQPLAVIGSNDNAVYAYSVEYGRLIGFFNAHEDAVSVVKLMRSRRRVNQLMTASWDASIKIWRLAEGRTPWEGRSAESSIPEIEITDHESAVMVAVHAQESPMIVSGTKDGMTTAWDLRSPQRPLWKLQHVSESVGGLALLPDDEHVLCGHVDGTIKLWSMKKPGEVVSSVRCASTLKGCLTDGWVSLHGLGNGQIALWNVAQCLGRSAVESDRTVPDAQGFFPPLQCSDASTVESMTIGRVSDNSGCERSWVVAGQENGNMTFFRSN